PRTGREPVDRAVEVHPFVWRCWASRKRVVVGVVDESRDVAPSRAHLLEHDIYGETVHPRGERALAAERREALPRADEDVLHEIAGLALVADHPAAECENLRRVRPVDRLERFDVAVLRAANDLVDRGVARRGGLLRG